MSLGDLSFIAAFVIFPLVIVALSVMALRTLSRHERRPLARFSSNNPAESTQELPIAPRDVPSAERGEKRDWSESVQPTRGPAAKAEAHGQAATTTFKVPTYRGRSTGVVRRISFQSKARTRPPVQAPIDETDQT